MNTSRDRSASPASDDPHDDSHDDSDDGSEGGFDPTAVAHDIEMCLCSQQALVSALNDMEPVDPSSPSRLPDWTVGHVLTHIARNGDSMVSMLSGAPQYPGGREQRNADIEAGASRSWQELLVDVEASNQKVADAFASFADWADTVETITGPRPAWMVPSLRQREVEVHRVDLGLGYEFADMPAEYVRRELRVMEMLWRANKPMGMTPLPSLALAAPPAQRLAWLVGRATIDGLRPADIY